METVTDKKSTQRVRHRLNELVGVHEYCWNQMVEDQAVNAQDT